MADIKKAGKNPGEATKVAILIHGRGASAEGILSLKDQLNLENFALFAPQAPGNSWYPYSFMAPDESNQPSFSNAISILDDLANDVLSQGFSNDQLYFIGFSQGACLSLEYAAQHGKKYGGIIAFTGGLIGEKLNPGKYIGDFAGTPVFIGSSQKDMHVPLERIEDSATQLEKMGAKVKTLIFKDTQHTIRKEELDWVNENILK